MNLTIEQEKILQGLSKTYKVLWQLYSREFKIYIILMCLIGIGLIIFGAFTPYTIHTQNGGREIYYNLNLSFSIGLAFLFLAIVYFRHMIRNKTVFFNEAHKQIGEDSLNRTNGIMQTTSDGIKLFNANSSHEYKWKCFSHYKIKDEILFLLTSNSYLNAIGIPSSLVEREMYDELLSFVKTRLIEKK